MDLNLRFSHDIPNQEDIYVLYQALGWNDFLKLCPDAIHKAMVNSYYLVNVYDGERLIATGRLISDGVMNAYACGLGVLEAYRHQGIGTQIVNLIKAKCHADGLHMQFVCEEPLVSFYESMGFKLFSIGMRYD